MKNISVEELKKYQLEGKDYFLIDVREPDELEIVKMEGMPYHNFPLGQITSFLEQIPTDIEVVVFCKMGGRSAKATEILEEKGYNNMTNLIGGMMAWGQASE